MTQQSNRLSSLFVQRAKQPGRYADGNGLYLEVSERGTKAWLFRFMLNGKARAMGLGPTAIVSLSEARKAALECRTLTLAKKDPIEERLKQRRAAELEAGLAKTFSECAEAYIESHEKGWKSAKHASQWRATIKTYAYPVFGNQPVGVIDRAMIMRVLEPLWGTKGETASRLRGRIEQILDWATVHGYRKGENPARWRGHLDKLLPKHSDVRKVKHFSALPISDLFKFMSALQEQECIAARALEFAILCAARSNEVFGAQWSEINLDSGVWVIPAERMKAKREHRVPLAPRAVKIIKEMRRYDSDTYVFPGSRKGNPLSNMAFLMLLRRMEIDVTAHGFRSTFRDWAGERTNYPREVAEAALAHTIKDKAEAAYRRGDSLEKRRKLMAEWAKFCEMPMTASGRVIAIRSSVAKTEASLCGRE